jgi:hypothetical protein
MNSKRIVLLGVCLLFSAATAFAQGKDGLSFGGVAPAAVVNVSVPATVQRGNVVNISTSYAALAVPLDATCIVMLPVNSTAYTETLVFSRKYSAIGVTAHQSPLFIPNFIQYEGTAVVIVIVEGAGVGVATFTVTP